VSGIKYKIPETPNNPLPKITDAKTQIPGNPIDFPTTLG
jgi:hypothetical protein